MKAAKDVITRQREANARRGENAAKKRSLLGSGAGDG